MHHLKNSKGMALAKKVGSAIPGAKAAYGVGKKIGGAVMGAKASYDKAWKNWENSPEHASKVKKIKKGFY